MHRLLIAATFAVLLVACGGSDSLTKPENEVLHFDGYDMTYRDFQLEMRGVLGKAGVFAVTACQQFNDMTPKEAIAFIKRNPKDTTSPTATPPPAAKAKPGQVGDDRSTERATEALLSECSRYSPRKTS